MTKARDLGDFISDGTIAETVTADGLDLGDNERIRLGDSQDLQILHNGLHSYIADSGTGNLYIQTTAGLIVQNSAGNETLATFTENSSVDLYYDNSVKVATSSTGATVTGTIAVSDSFNATSGTFTVQSNGTDILNLTSTVMSPQTDGAISLGSSSNGFNELHLDGNANIGGNVIINSTANTPLLRFDESGAAKFFIGESSVVGGGAGYDLYAGTGDGISLFTNASEAMRLDSSGNLLVGTTNGNPTGNHEPGTLIAEYGQINVQRDGGNPLRVGRDASDGALTEYYRQGVQVGKVEVFDSDNIGFLSTVSNHGGIICGTSSIVPALSGTYSNGATDIGSNTSKWRDLYLSGSVYANALVHDGDTDTYVGFTTNEINLYAGNTGVSVQPNGIFLFDGSLREDYDALSGTSPTCNVNNGGAFSLSMSGNTTFTFTSPTTGYSTGFVLQLTGNGGTVTWPSSVDWAGGTAPDAPGSGETDILVFWTRDGGTTWYGMLAMDAAA